MIHYHPRTGRFHCVKRTRVSRRRGWEVLCPTPQSVQRLTTLQLVFDAFLSGVEDETVTKMAKRPARWVGLPSAPALGRAVREFMLRRSFTLREFIMTLLLPSLRVALEFPTLFTAASPREDSAPTTVEDIGAMRNCSVVVNQPVVSFTRRQMWCLLSNMFFRTFASRTEAVTRDDAEVGGADDLDWVDARMLPTTDYTEIFAAPDGANNVEVTKLLLLFDFLTDAQRWTPLHGAEVEMTAYRLRVAPAVAQGLLPKHWCAVATASAFSPASSLSSTLGPLLPVVLHPLAESIDDQQGMIRLDFANRWIGGGALSGGAVQEEITFAQCPALNALRWYQSRMGHAESIVVTDYRQYGRVQAGTYGSLLSYGEAFCPPRTCRGALLAVDALDFRSDTVDEHSRAAVYREVMKLVSGLSGAAVHALPAVAGGNWGCGVFGGDYELKFLIQWAACGIAGKELHYCPFDNNAFEGFVPRVKDRLERGCVPALTTSNLITFLYQLEDAPDQGDDEAAPEEMRTATTGEAFGFVWSSFLRHFRLLREEESSTKESS
ncbi:putative poly (ADP-ribose) glycohydrolase [Leptomonas pyrrhocoris]|uniref:Putative poly (ADP-ribose) glycohydrolase n=1 Tax=Leptomonas pyrrhocoris TaxID=157538 RepID=A0A0M9G7H4_LEPPY|nr:putative poly (ADP-ribose) glycohydrolase [Leptomonas pyrrhocoris]XP_015662575.1 putative poly (ADP-ribose) glycohydrolase [Leptomonas pyrrhocoris]XP_015662576.1 putative poly (ADP-ribose) glycohydrolase [Leptomonas pyrrhocoris]XP_015662577.1 putative poly (ADP-ribose) glycohydrolase [Leptomonas pyrrhocoris]XP_015662578.1 putative poly (ADP-ribose) glycohydrolase [Leptomonas pyrrhocoris]KPA84135.1 putative poly (ADP-ribose) glycohydrolase [Leptomonas pyrrhocoris]KPA84136.1 putative poly (A|eukprot:XP_015662574.1 putative poly (ADP-ribose) glycohydrolase [Leptomonas pyrrhocoris]